MSKIILIFLFSFLVKACGKKDSPQESSQKDIVQFFTLGDPETLIQNTQRNTTSFITHDNRKTFDHYQRSYIYIFSEKEFYKPTSNIEEGQEPATEEETKKPSASYTFKALDSKRFIYEDSNKDISFIFETQSSVLNLVGVQFGEDEFFSATINHYSLSNDQSKMSFLLTIESEEMGKILLSATFYSEPLLATQTLKQIDPKYNYLLGPGVATFWKLSDQNAINIDICPSVAKHLDFDFISSAIKVWEKPFADQNKKFSITVTQANQCAPFSDVKQNAIHWVKDYLRSAEKYIVKSAATIPQVNRFSGEIIASNIILLEEEINKYDNYINYFEKQNEIKKIISHELGHFLGLDHNFEDSTSIMSYEDVSSLGLYDVSAIYELYKDQVSISSDTK